jgi:histidinol-phosphate aminotransferase
LIIRTFSKAYGLAGLRIGYAIADEAIVAQVNKVRKPFNTSSLAQVAAIAALKDQDFVRRTIELNAAELAYFYQQLDRLGLSYYRSYTNFIYMDTGMTSREMYERLLSHGVIIRPFLGNYIRVSMGLREQNEIFFTALRMILNEN